MNKAIEKLNIKILKNDKKGNLYIKIKNIRITYVDSKTRGKKENWPGKDTIRFNAYIDPENSDKIMKGAEIPIDDKSFIKLIEALCSLYLHKKNLKIS